MRAPVVMTCAFALLLLGLCACTPESAAPQAAPIPPPPPPEPSLPAQFNQLSAAVYRQYIEPLPRHGDLPFTDLHRPGAGSMVDQHVPQAFSADTVWSFAYDNTPVDGLGERAQLILDPGGQPVSLTYTAWSIQDAGVMAPNGFADVGFDKNRTWEFPLSDQQLPVSAGDTDALHLAITRTVHGSWWPWLQPLRVGHMSWQLGGIAVLRHWHSSTTPVYRIICHRAPTPGLLQVDINATGFISRINYAAQHSMQHISPNDPAIWGWLYRSKEP